MIDNFAVAGIGGIIIIGVIVQLAKAQGMSSRWAPVLAVALGVALALGNQIVQVYPNARAWYEALVIGGMAGAAASGFYDWKHVK